VKKIAGVIICIALLLVIVGCMTSPREINEEPTSDVDKEIKLTMISAWEQPSGIKLIWGRDTFIETVNERLSGRLYIEYLGGPEVMGPFEQLDAVKDGMFDMFATSPEYFSEMIGWWVTGFCPTEIQYQAVRENSDFMNDLLEPNNLFWIMNVLAGLDHYYVGVGEPVRTIDDLSGKKVRTYGGYTEAYTEFFPKVVPVTIPSGEVYSSLERRLLDGAILSFQQVVDQRVYEVADFVTKGPFASATGHMFINRDSWNKLPGDLQNELLKIGQEVEVQTWDFYQKMREQYEKDYVDIYGLKVVEVTPELEAKLLEMRRVKGAREVKESPRSEEIVKAFNLD